MVYGLQRSNLKLRCSFRFTIDDLQYAETFKVSTQLKTCFEAALPCNSIVIIDKALILKPQCDWRNNFLQSGTRY